MDRLIKAHSNGSFQQIVPAGIMRFLDFARLQLGKEAQYSGETGGREYVLDIFCGNATVRIETADGKRAIYQSAGGREDVFAGPPVMAYIPPNAKYEVTAESGQFDAGLFSAVSQATIGPALLRNSDVVAREIGRGNWQRTVYSALADNILAERLLAGETVNPPGNWSSYPPHKHDRHNPPQEAVLEEIYFFRIKPPQGYGFIWTYTAPDDEQGFSNVFVVEDGDTVLLPKGYHPVVAAPGYQLHYTWALAGEERRYGAWAEDPRHSWVRESH